MRSLKQSLRLTHVVLGISLFVLGLMFGAATVAVAQGEGTIQACAGNNGSLRVVTSQEECRSKETYLSWNIVGPQGPSGNLVLAGQQCPDGESVIGFDANGDILCSNAGPGPGICSDGETQLCSTGQQGECSTGIQTCTGGDWGACESTYLPSVEVCDGLDNDCDGVIDDAIPSEICGPASTEGACAQGTTVCEYGLLVCQGAVFPTDEVCNGVDDDCDGQTDEGCSCLDGIQQSCGSDVGACQSGVQTCINGDWTACEGEVGPSPEICNNIDDDCDGQTDELVCPLP